MNYPLTFRGDDGLPHRDELRAPSDAEAIAEARRLHPGAEWVLRKRRGQALEILAEQTATAEER